MTVVGIWVSACGGEGCNVVGIDSAILCADFRLRLFFVVFMLSAPTSRLALVGECCL